MAMQWGTAGNFAEVYEELMVPGFFGYFAADLVRRAELNDGDRLLDVACGTGVVPRAAVATGVNLGRLAGLDMTPGMLEVASRVAGDDGTEWIEGDATSMPFEDGSFDVLTCQQGLQFFPDREAGVREFRRVIAPGGRALVACWTSLEDQPAFKTLLEAAGSLAPELVSVGEAPFALGSADELSAYFEDAGFTQVDVIRVEHVSEFDSAAAFERSFSEGSPLAIALAELDSDKAAAIREAALRALEPLASESGFRAPMATHIAVARF